MLKKVECGEIGVGTYFSILTFCSLILVFYYTKFQISEHIDELRRKGPHAHYIWPYRGAQDGLGCGRMRPEKKSCILYTAHPQLAGRGDITSVEKSVLAQISTYSLFLSANPSIVLY